LIYRLSIYQWAKGTMRADYSWEERSNIRKYGLGGQHLYNSRARSSILIAPQSGDLGNRAAASLAVPYRS
jgi:hypothetical protein